MGGRCSIERAEVSKNDKSIPTVKHGYYEASLSKKGCPRSETGRGGE